MKISDIYRSKPVGIIGAGSFGTAVANLLSENVDVLLFTRQNEIANKINQTHFHLNVPFSKRVKATTSLEAIANECNLIFPVVPSVNFRSMMRDFAPYLRPYHLLIHGTKGFDLSGVNENILQESSITRDNVHTMSEVIRQESQVVRIGCLSGPNLSAEIIDGQPAATLIGSHFDEVIEAGKAVLQSQRFHVFGSHDILGAELAGALKNAVAIGSGILYGLGLGKNIQAVLLTRGLMEMIAFGRAMGSDGKAFVGTAGIGDLVATATSMKSRNFTFGTRIAKGESLEEINHSMPELAEGVRTIKIMRQLGKYYHLKVPITNILYSVVFEGLDPMRAIHYLISYPDDVDVDFL